MGVGDLKVWHWMLLGLLVGVAIAFAQSSVEPSEVAHTIKQIKFEQGLLREPGPASGGYPWVKDLVVFPDRKDKEGGGVTRVEFKMLVATEKEGVMEYQHDVFNADVPYQPLFPVTRYRALRGDSPSSIVQNVIDVNVKKAVDTAVQALLADNNGTLGRTNGTVRPGQTYLIPGRPVASVREYLTNMSSKYSWVHYHYAWWNEPRSIFTLWMSGCFLGIGVLWPASLRLMGIGPRKDDAGDFDLSRYGKGRPDKKPALAATAGLSAEEEARLAEMEARVVASLAAERGELPAAAPEPAPIRQLDNVPIEAPAATESEEDKEYKGEFYPVAHEAKHDDKPGAKPH